MDDYDKFRIMVELLTELEKGDLDIYDEIYAFERAINNSGYGQAYFGTTNSDYIKIATASKRTLDLVDIQREVKFYAEYYDGYQAPFAVCEWKQDFLELEDLLKSTSASLYERYQDVLSKNGA